MQILIILRIEFSQLWSCTVSQQNHSAVSARPVQLSSFQYPFYFRSFLQSIFIMKLISLKMSLFPLSFTMATTKWQCEYFSGCLLKDKYAIKWPMFLWRVLHCSVQAWMFQYFRDTNSPQTYTPGTLESHMHLTWENYFQLDLALVNDYLPEIF